MENMKQTFAKKIHKIIGDAFGGIVLEQEILAAIKELVKEAKPKAWNPDEIDSFNEYEEALLKKLEE